VREPRGQTARRAAAEARVTVTSVTSRFAYLMTEFTIPAIQPGPPAILRDLELHPTKHSALIVGLSHTSPCTINLSALAPHNVVLSDIATEVEHTMIVGVDEVGCDEGGKESGYRFHPDVVEIAIGEFCEF
jgi:hypothetical protein